MRFEEKESMMRPTCGNEMGGVDGEHRRGAV